MTSRVLSLLLMFSLALCAVIGAEPPAADASPIPSGENATRLMRGYWIMAKRIPDSTAESVSLELSDDGRLTLENVFKTKSGRLRIVKKGKWWVEGDTVYGEFRESSHPDISPAGYTTKDVILRLDDRVMELRTKEGGFERWERNIG